MPQDPIEEALKRPVIRKRKPLSIEEVLALPVIEQPRPVQPQLAPAPEPGFLENLGTNLKIGLQRAGLGFAEAERVALEAAKAAFNGDFGPIGQIAELTGRGALPIGRALAAGPFAAAPAFQTERAIQAPRIAELTRQREERLAAQPEFLSREAAAEKARLDVLASLDPSLAGQITRRGTEAVTTALPGVAVGVATGGSVPAIAGVTALQSLGQPENIIPAVALSAIPVPVGRAVAPLIRRIRGARAGAVQPATIAEILETPALPTQAPQAISLTGMGQAIGENFRKALRDSVIKTGRLPRAERGSSIGRAFESAVAQGAPRNVDTLNSVLQSLESGFPPKPRLRAEEVVAIQSAFQKLGTQNIDDAGAMIANANRRFNETITVPGGTKRVRTPAETQSSFEDFDRVSRLTPDENRALGQVLPERTFSPVVAEPGPGIPVSRSISDIPLSEPSAQLDANLRQLEAFFGAQGGLAQPGKLAAAIGRDAFDGAKVKVEDLGLGSKFSPAVSADAIPVRRVVKVDDLILGRDDLSKGRMFQVQEALNEGLKPGGAEFTTIGGRRGVVTDISVIPDPQNSGKFIVGGDGNHRTALLKLQGYTGDVPVVSLESPAQTAAMQIRGVPLNELEVAATRGAKIGEVRGPAVQQMDALNAGTLVAPAERAPILETISNLGKAGLLSRLVTHLRDIFGTGFFQLGDEAARVPAVIADMVRATIINRRTISGPNLAALVRRDAATKGIKEALEILRKGITAEDAVRLQLTTTAGTKRIGEILSKRLSPGEVARLDLNTAQGIKDAIRVAGSRLTPEDVAGLQAAAQTTSGSKVVDAYVNGVFRLMGAKDRFIRALAFRRALEDRANVQVLNEIRQGITPKGERAIRTRQLIANPDEGLAAGAISDAEIAVFNNDNIISSALGKARTFLGEQGAGGQVAKFALDTAVPFDRTPTNITARMLDFSPVGLLRGGAGLVNSTIAAKFITKQVFTQAEERAFAQLFGRGFIGTGLIALGWKLGEAGLMTGLFEDEPSKRARDVAAGRIPGAIRIGDTWHQVLGVAPFGNLLALGASLNREFEQERTTEGTSVERALFNVGARTIGEQPLLEGAASVTGLLQGRVNPAEEAGRIASRFVPAAGLVSDVAQAADIRRETRGEGFLGQIQARIPGASQVLPPAVDVLGRPLEDRFSRFIDPTLTSTARELREPLIRKLITLDVGLPKIEKKPKESNDAYLTRVRRFGELYQSFGLELMAEPEFRQLPESTQRKAFAALASRTRAQINEEFDPNRGDRFAKDPVVRLSPVAVIQSTLKSKAE